VGHEFCVPLEKKKARGARLLGWNEFTQDAGLAAATSEILSSASGGFAGGDLVAGRRVDIERANHGFGLKQVPNRFMHFLVLHALILLGILFGVPKAKCQNTIVLFV